MGEGEVSAESIGKTAFLGVAWPRDAKPIPSGAAGNTVDQNRLKPCRGKPFGLYGSWNRRVKTEIPVYTFQHRTETHRSPDAKASWEYPIEYLRCGRPKELNHVANPNYGFHPAVLRHTLHNNS